MFDLKNFIVTNIVSGVKNGTFTKEYANIMAVNYMLKGVLAEDDVIKISTEIEAWEAEQNAVVETVEPTEEEITVEDALVEDETEEEVLEETEDNQQSALYEEGEALS